jgi:hypothetical protein
MQAISRPYRSIGAGLRIATSHRPGPKAPARRHPLRLEGLEERVVLSGLTSITGNFNGTAIPANDYLWFSSVGKVQGVGLAPVTLQFTNQSITFVANGTTYNLGVPNSVVTISLTATTATTFDTSTDTWTTSVTPNFSGNVFLAGLSLPLPAGLPGGIKNVTWQSQVSSDTAGLTVNWQWAAAVYSHFSADESALGVKPVDDNHLGVYHNSDHAGTPEQFKSFVVGGATGGGGSNFTGSYSATGKVTPDVLAAPASIAGIVTDLDCNNVGIAGITITLTGMNNLGQTVQLTTVTAFDGSYQFTGLQPGTYALAETLPTGVTDDQNSTGTVGGSTTSDGFSGIVLNAGVNAIEYNFGDLDGGNCGS